MNSVLWFGVWIWVLLAKCSCLMMMTLKAAFLGHSYDSDMSLAAWRQLCDLQSIDRQAYRIFFEALSQSRSWRALCQPLHLDVELADLFLNHGDRAQVPCHRSMQACGGRIDSSLRYMAPKCVSQSDVYYNLSPLDCNALLCELWIRFFTWCPPEVVGQVGAFR